MESFILTLPHKKWLVLNPEPGKAFVRLVRTTLFKNPLVR